MKEEAEANAARNRSSLQVSLSTRAACPNLSTGACGANSTKHVINDAASVNNQVQSGVNNQVPASLNTKACANNRILQQNSAKHGIEVTNLEKKHVPTGRDKNLGAGRKTGVNLASRQLDNLVPGDDNRIIADVATHSTERQNKFDNNKNGLFNRQNLTKSGNRLERRLPQIDKNPTASRGLLDNREVPVVLLNSSGMATETISEKVKISS